MTEENKNAAGAQEATTVAEPAKAETVKEAPATFRFVIGEKVGMTQLFDEKGNLHGVSVVKAGDCKVVRVRTQEKDGYNAVCVGFGEVKESKLNKPEMGYFKKANVTPVKHMKECRVADVTGFEIGQVISLEKIFKPGDYVDVQGKIKGHGFAGQPDSHGQSDRSRAPGSLGSRRSLGKVISGQRMAGHYGTTTHTVAKIEVIKVDSENGLLFLKGSVPGARGSIVSVLETSKYKKHYVAPQQQKVSASKAANKK